MFTLVSGGGEQNRKDVPAFEMRKLGRVNLRVVAVSSAMNQQSRWPPERQRPYVSPKFESIYPARLVTPAKCFLEVRPAVGPFLLTRAS